MHQGMVIFETVFVLLHFVNRIYLLLADIYVKSPVAERALRLPISTRLFAFRKIKEASPLEPDDCSGLNCCQRLQVTVIYLLQIVPCRGCKLFFQCCIKKKN